jgi:hypothetical protein
VPRQLTLLGVDLQNIYRAGVDAMLARLSHAWMSSSALIGCRFSRVVSFGGPADASGFRKRLDVVC